MGASKRRLALALMYFAMVLSCCGFLSRTIAVVNTPVVQTVAVQPGAVRSAVGTSGDEAESSGAEDAGAEDVGAEVEERPYLQCLPALAVQQDGEVPYVLVVDERPGFFGTETYARRVNVSVVDRDAETVALGEGVLASGQRVIGAATQPVDDGDAVGVENA